MIRSIFLIAWLILSFTLRGLLGLSTLLMLSIGGIVGEPLVCMLVFLFKGVRGQWVLPRIFASYESKLREPLEEVLNLPKKFEVAVSEAMEAKSDRQCLSSKQSKPPKFGEYLLYFFLSKQDRINQLGDLEGEFREVQKKFGRKPAKIFYYKQVICSIGPLIWRKLAKWGAIAAVEEWIRRHI